MRRAVKGRIGVAAAAATLVLAVAGCSQPPSPQDDPTDSVFQGAREEYQQLVADCLIEEGWDITVQQSEDGSGIEILIDVGGDQERFNQYTEASSACSAALPPIPEPRTDDDIRTLFDHKVEQYECLLDNGFSPIEPPSFQTYLDDFRAQGAIWDPFGSLPPEQLTDGQRTCPLEAGSWW